LSTNMGNKSSQYEDSTGSGSSSARESNESSVYPSNNGSRDSSTRSVESSNSSQSSGRSGSERSGKMAVSSVIYTPNAYTVRFQSCTG
jgi:hypothetical protein